MVNFLLDTNVISEVRKKSPDPGVAAWFAAVPGEALFLSVLVVGEVRQGVERLGRRDPTQAARIAGWLETLKTPYGGRIVPISATIAEEWGRLNAAGPLPVVDGLLAATAKVHGFALVTRNTADVARTGVELLNPFGSAV
jgi:toxin FitB